MDFLKEALGEKLFADVEKALEAFNGDEANKDKQVKLANLAGGEYVGKGKYDALEAEGRSRAAELEAANKLVAELRKGTKGNEELQTKITSYETQVADLQAQLAETKKQAALKVALLAEKALDVDYLTYKITQQLAADNKALELDDNGNVKGWADIAAALKTQYPTQFEKAGTKTIDENKLPGADDENGGLTKSAILKMNYQDRVKLIEENPEGYSAAMQQK